MEQLTQVGGGTSAPYNSLHLNYSIMGAPLAFQFTAVNQVNTEGVRLLPYTEYSLSASSK